MIKFLAIIFACIFGYLFFYVTKDILIIRLGIGLIMACSGAIVGAFFGGIIKLISKLFK